MTSADTIRVTVKVFSWFAETLAPGQKTALTVEEALPPRATLRTLFGRLATRCAKFAEVIYDPRQDSIQTHVMISLNGRLVSGTATLDLELQQGNLIFLIPAYAGG